METLDSASQIDRNPVAHAPKPCISKPAAIVRKALRAAILIVAVDIALTALYLPFSAYLISAHKLSGTVDAALIFFGESGPYEGLSADTLRVVEHAAQLYHQKKVRHAACLGGGKLPGPVSGAQLMCRALAARSVPAEALKVDKGSWDTITNMNEARQLMNVHGWTSAALVSSPYHLPRILYLANNPKWAFSTAPPHSPLSIKLSTLLRRWREVNHEFAAWGAMALLPRGWYEAAIAWYRDRGLNII
ncbi:MAG: YdcF family protein [Deltaproteobacteria bacterium]|nr:YdcF family protein [Deltaproteobacteria bacterium]